MRDRTPYSAPVPVPTPADHSCQLFSGCGLSTCQMAGFFLSPGIQLSCGTSWPPLGGSVWLGSSVAFGGSRQPFVRPCPSPFVRVSVLCLRTVLKDTRSRAGSWLACHGVERCGGGWGRPPPRPFDLLAFQWVPLADRPFHLHPRPQSLLGLPFLPVASMTLPRRGLSDLPVASVLFTRMSKKEKCRKGHFQFTASPDCKPCFRV